MSYSFALSNGDLVLNGNQLGIVWGLDKLKQDLLFWLTETYGIDRFHPLMGSLLESYVGGVVNYTTKNAIESDILRVLNNYQSVQYRALKANPQNFSLSELLYSIDSINVKVGWEYVSADIQVHTAAGFPTIVTASMGLGG